MRMKLSGATVVTLFTGVNLLATLANQVVLAYLFGAGTSMDAFLACGAVPFMVLNLAIGDLGYVLIPLLMLEEDGRKVRHAISATFGTISMIAVMVTLVGILEHQTVIRLTTAANMPAATFQLAISLAPTMWVIVGFTILNSYLTGLHHFYRLFNGAAVTLALPYLGMIAGGLLGSHIWGIHAVVFGWLIGTSSRAAILFVNLPRPWPSVFSRARHPATRALLGSLFPLGLSLLPFAALPMIDVFWASRLPVGSISYLGYSTRVVIAITSIVVQGLSVVLFPDFSTHAREGRLGDLGQATSEGIQTIFAWIVPLAALAFLLRTPLLSTFLEHGKFTPQSLQGVAHVLPFYLLGTIWMAMMNIVSRSFFALRDYRTPAWTGLLALTAYVAMSGALITRFSYAGIGISYAVFWTLLFFLQSWLLGRKLGSILNEALFALFGKILLSAAAAIGACTLWDYAIPVAGHFGAHLLELTILFSAVYLTVSVGLFRLRQYLGVVQSVLNRGRTAVLTS